MRGGTAPASGRSSVRPASEHDATIPVHLFVRVANLHFSSSPPLSLYIHLPWCAKKCPYCDFNSHGLDAVRGERNRVPEVRYIEALIADLEHDLPRVWGRVVRTIFIGGGTPSLFSPDAIDRLLTGVRARLPLPPDVEITLEANPGAVESGHFAGYRAAGVNRLSLGIQSFDPDSLRALDRIHGSEEALRAVAEAREAGFDNFNLDLMHGLPRQTIESALRDVDTALALKPAHLSMYQLTIEPNTLFHAKPPQLPDEDATAAMQQMLLTRVAEAGYGKYEVSAFALAGRECQHNLNYWRFGDYLGIGAGAHGKITDTSGILRLWKLRHPDAYMLHAGTPSAIGGEQQLSPEEAAFEFMLNALRLEQATSGTLFTERTGLSLSVVEMPLRRAEDRGLIHRAGDNLWPTELGRRFLNDLIELFLPTLPDNGHRTRPATDRKALG